MQTYLKNLLPRLQQYSQALNQKELFIDQPWIHIDQQGNKQQYIFERDGTLIMSLNGNVQYGKWRLVSAGNSLLIDRTPVDSLLLNHCFFTNGVCILKKDGSHDEPWMLANERIIPDLNIKRYLRNLLPENRNLKPLPVIGDSLEYRDSEGIGATTGSFVMRNDDTLVTGVFQSSSENLFYDVQEGRIARIFRKEQLVTNRGVIFIEVNRWDAIKKGASVMQQNGEIADGIYYTTGKDSYIKMLVVENGQVKKVKGKSETVTTIYAVLACILLLVLIFAIIAGVTS